MIGPDGIYFFKEIPGKWTNHVDKNEHKLQLEFSQNPLGGGLIEELVVANEAKRFDVIEFK